MTRPARKFAVGETVIVLPHPCAPGGEGEIIFWFWADRIWCNPDKLFYEGWAYEITGISPAFTGVAETQLRKKHRPGDSFDQILQDLKRPVGVEA